MQETNNWNPDEYKKHTSFVSELALPVVDLLDPKVGESVLDLGCGDGTLALEIERRGANVLGVDLSVEMVQAAKENGIEAMVTSVTALPFTEEFDAIFSNAMLHWVKQSDLAIENIAKALKCGGRFVAEFGGEGNAHHLVKAMELAFQKHPEFGEFVNPWYFPSPAEYKTKLENNGFKVEYIELILRPTPMEDIGKWLEIFANGVTAHLSKEQFKLFKDECKAYLKEHIYTQKDGWIIDYVRLRIKAIKI